MVDVEAGSGLQTMRVIVSQLHSQERQQLSGMQALLHGQNKMLHDGVIV